MTLASRIDGNVIDEVSVDFRPGNHIAVDLSSHLYDHDTLRGNLRVIVGHHRCRFTPYARYIFDVSGTREPADPRSVIYCGDAD